MLTFNFLIDWVIWALDLYIFFLLFVLKQVLSANSFNQSVKESVTSILSGMETNHEELLQLDTVWSMLYNDCLSALEMCVEGDLKHFHKARYMLAQGLYKRGESGDIERAKDHLSFCFRSSRSSFTINMWEIDSMVKKGRYDCSYPFIFKFLLI